MKDLIALIEEAAAGVELTATDKASTQKKLIAIAINPFLVGLPLERARRLYSGSFRASVDTLLLKMAMPQLKKASKKWNPHRPAFPKETALSDVRAELVGLLKGDATHEKPVKPEKAKKTPKAKKGSP